MPAPEQSERAAVIGRLRRSVVVDKRGLQLVEPELELADREPCRRDVRRLRVIVDEPPIDRHRFVLALLVIEQIAEVRERVVEVLPIPQRAVRLARVADRVLAEEAHVERHCLRDVLAAEDRARAIVGECAFEPRLQSLRGE